MLLPVGIDDSRSFWREAAYQQVCAVCLGATAPDQQRILKQFEAHHVVYKAFCERLRLPLYHTTNALRLCVRCHDRHHSRQEPVPVIKLTDENIAFVVFAYGPAAPGWLERYYDFTVPDPRVEHQLELAA